MRRALVTLLVCGALPALAADRPKLVVVPLTQGEGAPEAAPGRFTSQVVEELKSRDDVLDVVSGPAFKAAPPPKSNTGKPSPEATAALDAGRKALADLKFDEAMEKLRKGIDLSLADPATADYPAVLEAHISLAVAAFRQGDEREAQNTMLALARMDPNYSIPSGYPPAFTREFDRAKKKLEKAGKGSISVEGPSGATVYIDGRDLGMVPVLEENLAWGTHYVKVDGAKNDRFGQVVELKGSMAKVRANFGGGASEKGGGVADPRVAASLDDSALQRVGAYTKAAGADFALVGIVYRTGDNQLTAGTAIYSASKKGFSALPGISFDSDALTSNVEAYRLAEEVTKKLSSFGSAVSLPHSLLTKPVVKQSSATASKMGDVDAAVPTRTAVRPKENADLTPKTEVRALDKKSEFVDTSDVPPETGVATEPGAELKKGAPTWLWITVGVVAAAGAGVGGYFIYREASRPVTGAVSATW